MTIYNNNGVQILKAAEGKYLTQKILSENDIRTFHTMITVTDATKDNFREATQKEKEDYETALINKSIS